MPWRMVFSCAVCAHLCEQGCAIILFAIAGAQKDFSHHQRVELRSQTITFGYCFLLRSDELVGCEQTEHVEACGVLHRCCMDGTMGHIAHNQHGRHCWVLRHHALPHESSGAKEAVRSHW